MLTQQCFAYRLAIHFVKLLQRVYVNRQQNGSLSQCFITDFEVIEILSPIESNTLTSPAMRVSIH